MSVEHLLAKMRREWDKRAKENAMHFVATGREAWSQDDFWESGRQTIQNEILTDMTNICQERDPKQMRVLEIGCGAGRLTRALSELFGEVHAIDVSPEMVRLARESLVDRPNAFVHINNGFDLSILDSALRCDFAFSFLVFQHIPSKHVIENYMREVHRILKPGGLFKCQVQGCLGAPPRNSTWFGVPLSERDAREMAEHCGFELRYTTGSGTQYFWLWMFRKP